MKQDFIENDYILKQRVEDTVVQPHFILCNEHLYLKKQQQKNHTHIDNLKLAAVVRIHLKCYTVKQSQKVCLSQTSALKNNIRYD